MRPAGQIIPARSVRAANLVQHRELVPSHVDGCLMWLDSSLLADGLLEAWPDKSEAGHEVTQATASLRPNVVSGVVNFDGADDYMDVSHSDFAIDQVTMFLVLDAGATPAGDRMLIGQLGLKYGMTFHNGSTVYGYIAGGSNYVSKAIAIDDGNKHSLALTFNGSTDDDGIRLYHNGELVASAASASATTSAGDVLQVGGSATGNDFVKDFYHAAVFNSALRGDQISSLHRSLI